MALTDREMAKAYPTLDAFASPLKKAERPIIGRDEEMRGVKAALMRPELCNVILLAEPGSGKTALVQGLMESDKERVYLEVDPAKMLAGLNDKNEMAARIKSLFDDTARLVKENGREIVLFIDEFHQIVQLSDAAVEALKPMLADSGTRGIRVIAATTYVEFRRHIAPNQPLVERLQRFNLKEPDKSVVVQILKGMAERYKVSHQFYNNKMYELIYEYTERYIPANSQPRKSILLMDNMIGWHRAENRKIDQRLLADVIYATEGINVAFRVDARGIKRELDAHVFAQEMATNIIEQRLQICIADLNNHDKPMSSFLFTGSTGVGKDLDDDILIPVYTQDGSVHHKRNGDLVVGDYVFSRDGRPEKVIGVYPQGVRDIYEVELADGRVLSCGAGHLWQYRQYNGGPWKVADTVTLMQSYVDKKTYGGRKASKFKHVIPMNGAVAYPEAHLFVDPYVMGVLLGNGCLTVSELTISSNDESVVSECSSLLGAAGCDKRKSNYDWVFRTGEMRGNTYCRLSTKDVLSEVPSLIGCKSHEKFIPDCYRYSSIEQRWALVQGMFDTDGTIDASTGRYNVSYSTTSHRLALDLQDVLYSLGISSSVNNNGVREGRDGDCHDEWDLHVKCVNSLKSRFFRLERKKAIADLSVSTECDKHRVRNSDSVIAIRDIRKTCERKSTTCIMVDDDEHLYQAGQYIVTHNTEITKQLARLLFNDERNLIRLDMTEFALPESMERFRSELTNRVWERPYSIVLLDEIEKACAPVTRLLLQVLDDGRLIDENNREVTFKNCYVVMTTNAGSEIYKKISQYAVDNRGSGEHIMKYMKLIKRSIAGEGAGGKFPPELLGRIDCIVPFQPLSEETMKRIVEGKIRKLIKDVADKHNKKLRVSKDVIRYLIIDGMDTDSDSGGARAVVSKLESEVTMAIARFINAHPEIETLQVSVEGEMAADNLHKLESDAYIKVTAVS